MADILQGHFQMCFDKKKRYLSFDKKCMQFVTGLEPGAHFTNDFSIVIQIQGKIHSSLIQVLVKWLLLNFAHGTTAVLLWHVQNLVVMSYLTVELYWN